MSIGPQLPAYLVPQGLPPVVPPGQRNDQANAAAASDLKSKLYNVSPIAGALTGAATASPSSAAPTYVDAKAASTVIENTHLPTQLALPADVLILATGHNQVEQQVRTASKQVSTLASARTSANSKLDAVLGLSQIAQGIGLVAQQTLNSSRRLANQAKQLPSVARTADRTREALDTPSGRLVTRPVQGLARLLDRAMPVLNVAVVANSTKAAVATFRDRKASDTSKGLAMADVAASGGLLAASLASAGTLVPVLAVAGIGLDLGLIASRDQDHTRGNTDQVARQLASHPLRTANQVSNLGAAATTRGILTAWNKISGWL